MRRVWKGLLVACILYLCLLPFWFLGNYLEVLPAKTASGAARLVIAKYEARPPERVDIQPLSTVSDFPQGKRTTYMVSVSGRPIARVTLLDFLGLGWQEVEYERLPKAP